MDLKWQVAMISMRLKKFCEKTGRKLQFDAKELVGFDKTKFECYNCHKTGHFARECRSKGNQDSRRRDTWNTRNKAKDNERKSGKQEEPKALWEPHGDASIEFSIYSSCKKVEEPISCHQQKSTLMSVRDKAGLGYGDQMNKGVLSYENEVFGSLFYSRSSNIKDSPVNDRYAEGMHAQSKPSESDARSSDFNSCESNSSKETNESVPKPVANEPKAVSDPKVSSDAPIIEEYESDSHDLGTRPILMNIKTIIGGTVALKGMCDKKNKVLFTDTECLMLSPDFKLPDENQVLLRVPRQNNMYSFNLENIVPSECLACLITKAIVDESNKWHRRLGHVNFKNLNKLVKGNLVRGLPSKIFQNDHTCVACQKGMQHKASCKAKSVSSISQPLQLLHMDLFGPASVRSINHKTYYLVITDDFSRSKGIKREYSNARTPQQSGVAERKNRTLIEAARTMLADLFLPNTFWAYVLNRVLVTKPQNKTPYELITGKGANWLFDLDYLTDSMNYQPVRSENQANKHAGPKEANHSAGTQDNIDAGNSEIWEAESTQDLLCTANLLKRQEKEANDAVEALRKEFTQDTEDLLLQVRAARSSSPTTVNTASTPVSTASPSGGLSYTDLTNTDQDDSQIPALEDSYDNPNDGIFTNASYDDEGAVADFTNLETIVNVSPIPTSRIHSIHPSTQILGDPKSAVQTRSKVNKSSGAHAFVSYIQKQRRNNHKDFQHCLFACFLSQIEPKKISEALEDESWVDAMQEELLQFKIQKVWILVDLPYGKKAIGTK
ncbi:putative ribonuclease H-like domain-containing protein [Tanacetum coccineum]